MGKLAAFARKYNYDFQIIPFSKSFSQVSDNEKETNFWILHHQYGWLLLRHDYAKPNSEGTSVIVPEGYWGQCDITKRIAKRMKEFKYNFINPKRYQCLALPSFSKNNTNRKNYLRYYYDSLKYNRDLFSNAGFVAQIQFNEQLDSNHTSYIFKYDENLVSLQVGDHVLVKTHHRSSNKLIEKRARITALIPSTNFYPHYQDKIRINLLRKVLPIVSKIEN